MEAVEKTAVVAGAPAGALAVRESVSGLLREKRKWLARAIIHVGPDLIVLGFFSLLYASAKAIHLVRVNYFQSSILLPLAVMIILITASFVPRLRGILHRDRVQREIFFRSALKTVRDWLPLVLIIFIYENFHDLTDLVRPNIVDDKLREWDRSLLGFEPALTLQTITNPLLTEFMTFAYALYFVFPAVLFGLIYFQKDYRRFHEVSLAFILCFYLGLVGYLFVPAIGPRYFMADAFRVPLSGIWLTDLAAAAWNVLESVKRDCFPSLHTALTTIALIYFVRFRRIWHFGGLLLAVFTPLIVSLWMSTLYLRYHYGVDVLAGWLLAYFCCSAAPRFVDWYYRQRAALLRENGYSVSESG